MGMSPAIGVGLINAKVEFAMSGFVDRDGQESVRDIRGQSGGPRDGLVDAVRDAVNSKAADNRHKAVFYDACPAHGVLRDAGLDVQRRVADLGLRRAVVVGKRRAGGRRDGRGGRDGRGRDGVGAGNRDGNHLGQGDGLRLGQGDDFRDGFDPNVDAGVLRLRLGGVQFQTIARVAFADVERRRVERGVGARDELPRLKDEDGAHEGDHQQDDTERNKDLYQTNLAILILKHCLSPLELRLLVLVFHFAGYLDVRSSKMLPYWRVS